MTVDVQILVPDPDFVGDVFIIGTNKVGDPLTDGAPDPIWQTYLDGATDLDFNRGGNSSDLNALDVGMLTLGIKDADIEDIGLRPNKQIRVVRPKSLILRDAELATVGIFESANPIEEDSTQFFSYYGEPGKTVSIVDGGDYYDITTNGLSIGVTIRLPSRSEVESLYGEELYSEHTSLHIAFYLPSKGANVYRLMDSNVDGSDTYPADSYGYADGFGTFDDDPHLYQAVFTAPSAGLTVRVRKPQTRFQFSTGYGNREIWRGKVQDLSIVDSKKYRSGTLTAADAMAPLSNIKLYGPAVQGGGQTFLERMNYLEQYSTVPLDVEDAYLIEPVKVGAEPSDWTFWGTYPTNTSLDYIAKGKTATGENKSGVKYRTKHTGTSTQNQLTSGIRTTITGLEVGNTYQLTGYLALSADFIGVTGDIPDLYRIELSNVNGVVAMLDDIRLPKQKKASDFNAYPISFEFYAEEDEYTLGVSMSEQVKRTGNGVMEALWISNFYLTNQSADPFYLDHLGEELSLVEHMNIACDSVGGIWRVENDGSIAVRRFIAPIPVVRFSDEDEPSYTDLSMAYNTTDVVNVLQVKNYDDTEQGYTDYTYTNEDSIALYGERSKNVTMNLISQWLVEFRAEQILAERADAQMTPTSLTYKFDDEAEIINVHDAIEVERRGEIYLCLVTGVKHDVQPDRHLTTLTLRRII